jgi:hypothetical protein
MSLKGDFSSFYKLFGKTADQCTFCKGDCFDIEQKIPEVNVQKKTRKSGFSLLNNNKVFWSFFMLLLYKWNNLFQSE